jgi:glycosyltransferase involved in cell wall biosynthesis
MFGPQAIVSFGFGANIVTWLASIFSKTPLIFSEHVDPAFDPTLLFPQLLRRLIYPQSYLVICVSHGIRARMTWLKDQQVVVIHNPITEDMPAVEMTEVLMRPTRFVAMGRLEMQKGFDLLIKAFAKVRSSASEWSLHIYGEGSQRRRLEQLIQSLGLAEAVKLHKVTAHPSQAMQSAQIFVLSSRYEGFGNVIVEALNCGLAVISTRCPSGPDEIIEDGISGLLVENESVDAIASAMARLARDGALRQQISEAGVRRSRDFTIRKSAEGWRNGICRVVRQSGNCSRFEGS